MKRTEMKLQEADVRRTNFDEVALGYSKEEAITEATRCLNCKNPLCVKGCPVGIMIPKFIELIKLGDVSGAYKIIKEAASMPAICGRVCPQEKQCEKYCVQGYRGDAIAIGALERFVADEALKNDFDEHFEIVENHKKIAIIGSGPSGLTCAYETRKMGYDVTIYEALHECGGVLTYGIPEFRLPKKIVKTEIERIKSLGVKICTNVLIGKTITMEELTQEYDAIYIATGAGLPKFMNIPNINANGVLSANELLTRVNLMKANSDLSSTPIKSSKKTVVVGGGNVALDAARVLKRLGSDVTIMYHRSENELPARKDEINHAKSEEIQFEYLKNPVEIMVDENNEVTGIKYIDMELLDEVDASNRRKVKEIKDSYGIINTDMVVMAIGNDINSIAFKDTDIKVTNSHTIEVLGTKTNVDKIFAGGDVTLGASTVILACGVGKIAAKEIDEFLGGKK